MIVKFIFIMIINLSCMYQYFMNSGRPTILVVFDISVFNSVCFNHISLVSCSFQLFSVLKSRCSLYSENRCCTYMLLSVLEILLDYKCLKTFKVVCIYQKFLIACDSFDSVDVDGIIAVYIREPIGLFNAYFVAECPLEHCLSYCFNWLQFQTVFLWACFVMLLCLPCSFFLFKKQTIL